jgi:hypothetical protein
MLVWRLIWVIVMLINGTGGGRFRMYDIGLGGVDCSMRRHWRSPGGTSLICSVASDVCGSYEGRRRKIRSL